MTRLGLAVAILVLTPQDPPPAVDAVGDPIPAGATFRLGSKRFQHADQITGLRYSRDGKRLFTSSWFAIKAWDSSDGRLLGKITGGQGTLESMAVAPDGRTVYTTGCNILHTYAWDVETGKEKFRLQGPGEGPNFTGGSNPGLSISDDGKRLATAIRDDAIRVWDLEKRREVFKRVTVDGKQLHYSGGVSISGDGRLVTAIGPDALYVFEVDTGKVALKITGSMRLQPSFSPDGKRLACSGIVRAGCEIWDLAESKRICEIKSASPMGFRWTPDGQSCAWWESGALVIGDPATGEARRRIEGHFLAQLDFSPDGKTLAAASAQAVRLFEVATGREVTDPGRGGASYWSMTLWDYSPDGRLIASAGAFSPLRFWDPRTGREVSRISVSAYVQDMKFSPDGRTLSTFEVEYNKSAVVRRWDVLTGRQIARWEHDLKNFDARGSFSPDARYLVAWDRKLTIVADALTGAVVRTQPRSTVQFSPDGRLALLKGAKISVQEWESQKELWSEDNPKANYDYQDPAFFSPDGRELVLCRSGLARVVETATGRTLREIPVDASGVEYYYFTGLSHDGKLLITQSYDGQRVDHWDLLKPGPPKTYAFDEKPGSSRFASDGSSWATGMYDSTILVWKLKPDPPAMKPAVDLETLWERLGSKDIVEAWAAADSMVPLKGTPAFLDKRLKDRQAGPVRAEDVMRKLIASLDADELDVREKAQADLRSAGPAAEPALLEGMEAKPSAETEVRLRRLLDAISVRAPAHGDEARRFIAIRILERTGDPGSRLVLETLRSKAPTWAERLAAIDALERPTRKD